MLCRLSNGPPLSLRNGLKVLMKTRGFPLRPSDFVLQYSLIANLCFLALFVLTVCRYFVLSVLCLSFPFCSYGICPFLCCHVRDVMVPYPHCFNRRVLANNVFHQCASVKQLVVYVLENFANVPGR